MTLKFDLTDKADVGIHTVGLYLEGVESQLQSHALAGIRKQEPMAHFVVRDWSNEQPDIE